MDKTLEIKPWNFVLVHDNCRKTIICTKLEKVILTTMEERLVMIRECAENILIRDTTISLMLIGNSLLTFCMTQEKKAEIVMFHD